MSSVNRTIWEPAEHAWEASRLSSFARHVVDAGGPRIERYEEALNWSLTDPGAFWAALADWGGMRFHDTPDRSLADASMPGAAWFPGATLNHAELALRQAAETPDASAVVSVSQTRDRAELS